MQSSHTITLDWVEIWTAYLEAGLSKREFYRQCLPNLISSRCVMNSLRSRLKFEDESSQLTSYSCSKVYFRCL